MKLFDVGVFAFGIATGMVLFLLGRKGERLRLWWWERKRQKAAIKWIEKHGDEKPDHIFRKLG